MSEELQKKNKEYHIQYIQYACINKINITTTTTVHVCIYAYCSTYHTIIYFLYYYYLLDLDYVHYMIRSKSLQS